MPSQDIELILLRQWASYMALPVFITANDGVLFYYNEAAEVLLGRRYDETAVDEMPVAILADTFETTDEQGAPIPSAELPIAIALRGRRPAHRRLRIRGLDSVWRTIEVTAFPVDGAGGRQLGAVALFWEAHR